MVLSCASYKSTKTITDRVIGENACACVCVGARMCLCVLMCDCDCQINRNCFANIVFVKMINKRHLLVVVLVFLLPLLIRIDVESPCVCVAVFPAVGLCLLCLSIDVWARPKISGR